MMMVGLTSYLTHRAFLKNVLTNGLSKYGIIDIFIGKDVKVNLAIFMVKSIIKYPNQRFDLESARKSS